MAQLRAAYPNAMRLDYLPQGEVAHPLDMTQAVRGKPFVELFQDFFYQDERTPPDSGGDRGCEKDCARRRQKANETPKS